MSKDTADFHAGDEVRYVPPHAHGDVTHKDCENGIVSRINERSVFVRYYRDGVLQKTPQSTTPSDLLLTSAAMSDSKVMQRAAHLLEWCAESIRQAVPVPKGFPFIPEMREIADKLRALAAMSEQKNQQEPVLWLVWSEEHRGYWPQSRCGYVPLSEAGRFTYDEALSIVTQGNYGMDSIPEESMLPVPHPTILERAALAEKGKP